MNYLVPKRTFLRFCLDKASFFIDDPSYAAPFYANLFSLVPALLVGSPFS